MSNYICWLITILYEGTLMRCALKIDKWSLPEGRIEDITNYPMEPENRELIHSRLPEHVRSCGPIVAIEEIFEVHADK